MLEALWQLVRIPCGLLVLFAFIVILQEDWQEWRGEETGTFIPGRVYCGQGSATCTWTGEFHGDDGRVVESVELDAELGGDSEADPGHVADVVLVEPLMGDEVYARDGRVDDWSVAVLFLILVGFVLWLAVRGLVRSLAPEPLGKKRLP